MRIHVTCSTAPSVILSPKVARWNGRSTRWRVDQEIRSSKHHDPVFIQTKGICGVSGPPPRRDAQPPACDLKALKLLTNIVKTCLYDNPFAFIPIPLFRPLEGHHHRHRRRPHFLAGVLETDEQNLLLFTFGYELLQTRPSFANLSLCVTLSFQSADIRPFALRPSPSASYLQTCLNQPGGEC
jgi:hypothetical protein